MIVPLLALTCPLVAFFLHLVWERMYLAHHPFVSRQSTVARICIGTAVAYSLAVTCVYRNSSLHLLLINAVYLLVASLGFNYVYFHIYNMSETARRIHILVTAYEAMTTGNPEAIRDLKNYGPRVMIERRLERLVLMGALRREGDRYFTRPSFIMAWSRLWENKCWRYIF